MSLLLVDAGNTRVKWALCAAGQAEWQASGAVLHDEVDGLQAQWQGAQLTRILVSNVAGAQMHDRLLRAFPAGAALEWFTSSAQRAGLVNGYREPAKLGSDRFASAIGAHSLYPGEQLIVATCGTATTIDAISADGIFLGGMILPGLGLMAASLAKNTAQLPQVAAGLSPDQPFADYTDAAIASGCLAAQAGAIERAVLALGERGPVRCILSGGAANLVALHLTIPCEYLENLVLRGLHTVAESESPC